MSTITISKKEYHDLTEKKLRYEYLRQILEGDIFSPPPTKSKKEAIALLAGTKRYSKKFIKSIQKGLSRSSHFSKP